MAHVYLSLGSNQGNRAHLLLQAIEALNQAEVRLVECSDFWDTEPQGFSSPHRFLNIAIHAQTTLSPTELLHVTQQIERQLGRAHKTDAHGYADRPIDIDILLYDAQIIQTSSLIVPHPRLHERLFVLQPLAQIAPKVQHPLLHQSITQLLARLLADNPTAATQAIKVSSPKEK